LNTGTIAYYYYYYYYLFVFNLILNWPCKWPLAVEFII
jgi:hypothetical protein